MRGSVRVRGHAGSGTAASIRGGLVHVAGDAGARAGHRHEGRHARRRRRRRLHVRLHDAARHDGRLRGRGRRPRATRCTRASSTSPAPIESLRCGRGRGADDRRGRRPSPRCWSSVGIDLSRRRVPQGRVGPRAVELLDEGFRAVAGGSMSETATAPCPQGPGSRSGALPAVEPGGRRGHLGEGDPRPLPDHRRGHAPARAVLRRPDVRAVHAVPPAAGGLPRAVRDPHRAGRRGARPGPIVLDRPITIAGHVLRRPVEDGQDGARRGRDPTRDLHDHRRRRHARRGAGRLAPARLPGPAEPVRVRPRAPQGGGRDRGRRRTGREARHGRAPAGREGVAGHRRAAHAARGRRPAQPRPAPGLHRPGRPADQDRGAARGHGLAGADLRQDGREPSPRRRQARGEGRRRRDRPGRAGGGDRARRRRSCSTTRRSRR